MSQFLARLTDLLGTLYGVLKTAVASLLSPALRPLSFVGEPPELSAAEARRGQAALLNRDAGTKDQSGVLGGLLDLFELEVSDLMVHRTKMRTIDAELPRRELVGEMLASPFSRLPLWRGRPENIVGIVHAKDVLRALHVAGGDPEATGEADDRVGTRLL